ncbi:GntR family transcriptional regulator [Mesorhizobium sp. BAC0120]|uniref:GntR family transcriptional regulator n=1 Tax=Mesorhizobium sp. BAC0120 TaxID=3090670 RepID=UPI00298C6CD3|nr:GntR family transcriptional regulator [Mesorhizobium sp. BAC0120]MDW6024730.1 GntR family transcriptional regulator [Mesorhizobium sp. BAC0120]
MTQQAAQRLETEVVETIREAIIFGRLRPRERLVEEELSERFNTSRHVIRAAMVTLEQIGLVTRRPNRGVVVRDFSVEEVEELYEMRAILQAEAARRIPMPAPRSLIEELERIHSEYSDCVDRMDLKQTAALNNVFHETLFAACNNRFLAEAIATFWARTTAIRCYAIGDPILLQQSRNEHRAMIDALVRGDRESLVSHCVSHIYPSLEAYKRAHGGWSLVSASAGEM